jgi:hypothetical protein
MFGSFKAVWPRLAPRARHVHVAVLRDSRGLVLVAHFDASYMPSRDRAWRCFLKGAMWVFILISLE